MWWNHTVEGRVKDVWKEDGSHATNFLLNTIENQAKNRHFELYFSPLKFQNGKSSNPGSGFDIYKKRVQIRNQHIFLP